ncbi:hypothetical protein L917_07306 [Phytophthora nicotianae]|uniref:Uncharacterized protein n=1 Tax=Phytophthora nicotianae TaxID=4792 RepID=W2LBP5_PHYNI|nr:hypothetical protein L917_07306 [Phytophthora nicotianae]ETM48052.1 hypothetical protein L914_07370 [Phytophthora nicotianae]
MHLTLLRAKLKQLDHLVLMNPCLRTPMLKALRSS